MTDVNDGIGPPKQEGQWMNVGELAIGKGVARERHLWGAGHRLRELMEEHGQLPSTARDRVAYTFFDAHGNSSMIDHVILPLSVAERLRSHGPFRWMGTRLQ
eukprot:9076329-Pyramimonas_sp.AAC.1